MKYIKDNALVLVGIFLLLGYVVVVYQNFLLDKKVAIAEFCTPVNTQLPQDQDQALFGTRIPTEKSSRSFETLDQKCLEFFSK